MNCQHWNVPQGIRPVCFIDKDKNPPYYTIAKEGDPEPSNSYTGYIPITYTRVESVYRFSEEAMTALFQEVTRQITHAHSQLEISGQLDLTAHLLILHSTLEYPRDPETRNYGATVGWGGLFGEIPDPPPWLQKVTLPV